MIASGQNHHQARPIFGGLQVACGPIDQQSIDATPRGGFWIAEPVHIGVDADTAALRARIRDASRFARLSVLLGLTR